MAEDTSPNSLAGQPNATDELLEMVKPQPTPQVPVMPAPQDGSAVGPAPGFGPIAGLPPEPTKGGISEDIGTQFARQLAKNTDTLTQSNPAAVAKPGGWARAILGGAMTTLAGGGFSLGQPQPEGSVGINGVQSAVNAYKDRLRDSQNRAQAQKQQSFENDLKLRKEKREEEAQNAAIAFNKINIAKAQDSWDEETQNRFHKQFYEPWAKDEKENKGATLIQEGMTSQELQQLAKRHAPSDGSDPNGSHWLAAQDVRPDGYRVDTDINGDPVDQIGPDGKPTGRHERTQTWAAYTYGDPTPMSAKTAADAKKYGLGNFSEGEKLKPQDAALLRVQIGKAMVDEQSADTLALAAGKSKDDLEKLQRESDYRAAGTALTPWLIDSQGDVGKALQNMATHAQEKTPEGQEASKQYNLVIKAFGGDIVKNQMDLAGKKELETIKANAVAAKNKPLDVEGDPNLRGAPYIASLPPQTRPTIEDLGTGNLDFPSLQRILGGKDGIQLIKEIALAYPDLAGADLGELPKVYHNFKSGAESRAINAGATAIDSLKRLNDLSTKESLIPGSNDYNRFHKQLDLAAVELAKFVIGGNGQPTEKEIEAQKETLLPSTAKTGWNRTSGILQAVDGIRDKYREYKNTWDNTMPNDDWRKKHPMPGMSREALANMAYLDNVSTGMSYQQAEAIRQQQMSGTAAPNAGVLNKTTNAPKSVSIGGKQVPLNADGTVTVGGHPYEISKDGKSLTLINPGTK